MIGNVQGEFQHSELGLTQVATFFVCADHIQNFSQQSERFSTFRPYFKHSESIPHMSGNILSMRRSHSEWGQPSERISTLRSYSSHAQITTFGGTFSISTFTPYFNLQKASLAADTNAIMSGTNPPPPPLLVGICDVTLTLGDDVISEFQDVMVPWELVGTCCDSSALTRRAMWLRVCFRRWSLR